MPVIVTAVTSVILYLLSFAYSKFFKGTMEATMPGGLSLCIEIAVYAALGIFVTAGAYFYLKMSRTTAEMTFNDFLVGLGDYYLSGILGFLWYLLWVVLWSFLFVIPGIIKAISYSMMFFVIVENPGISVRKAMEISKVLTFGHKMELFAMLLSFFGWYLLCLITGGIAGLWVDPYVRLSYSNAYTALKMEAFQVGVLKPSDFAN